MTLILEQGKRRPYQCQWEGCHERFESVHDILEHLKHHVGTGQHCYTCKWRNCSRKQKEFSLLCNIIYHLNTHAKDASTEYPCGWEECHKNFDALHLLVNHLQDHINQEKPVYRCRWIGCERNGNPLGNRSKIVEHLRTHTKEQPFQCQVPGCLKKFTKKSSVMGHYRRYHYNNGNGPLSLGGLDHDSEHESESEMESSGTDFIDQEIHVPLLEETEGEADGEVEIPLCEEGMETALFEWTKGKSTWSTCFRCLKIGKTAPAFTRISDPQVPTIFLCRDCRREEEIIRCICQRSEEHTIMLQCDNCYIWQHGDCVNIQYEWQIPPAFLCTYCQQETNFCIANAERNDAATDSNASNSDNQLISAL